MHKLGSFLIRASWKVVGSQRVLVRILCKVRMWIAKKLAFPSSWVSSFLISYNGDTITFISLQLAIQYRWKVWNLNYALLDAFTYHQRCVMLCARDQMKRGLCGWNMGVKCCVLVILYSFFGCMRLVYKVIKIYAEHFGRNSNVLRTLFWPYITSRTLFLITCNIRWLVPLSLSLTILTNLIRQQHLGVKTIV